MATGEIPRRLAAVLAPGPVRHLAQLDLGGCYTRPGEHARARAHASEVMRLDPGFSAASYIAALHYRREDDRAHHYDSLVKAGLPL